MFLSLGLLGVLSLAGTGLVSWLTPDHNITPTAYEGVKQGMTKQQVLSLFHVPPGTYTSFGEESLQPIDPGPHVRRAHVAEDWCADNISVRVCFDEHDRVLFACSVSRTGRSKSLLQRFLVGIGL
jgi:hypothetical protein